MTTIFRHGFDYAGDAMFIWKNRQNKLLCEWNELHAAPLTKDSAYDKERISRIMQVLISRCTEISKEFGRMEKQAEDRKREADEEPISLSCETFECKTSPVGFIMIVKRKDYIPNKITCSVCGSALRSEGDIEIERQLHELGIDLPK